MTAELLALSASVLDAFTSNGWCAAQSDLEQKVETRTRLKDPVSGTTLCACQGVPTLTQAAYAAPAGDMETHAPQTEEAPARCSSSVRLEVGILPEKENYNTVSGGSVLVGVS